MDKILSPERRAKGLWWDRNYNVLNGCAPVSPGCKNCFAEVYVNRFKDVNSHFEGLIKNGKWTGRVNLRYDKLDMPLHIKKPTVFFVTERGDLFNAPFEFINKVFTVMAVTPQHIFIVLTKQASHMAKYHEESLTGLFKNLPNVYLGITAENQKSFDERWQHFKDIPAAVKFLSVEPMLSEIKIHDALEIAKSTVTGKFERSGWKSPIGGVICGSESGPNSRETNIEWVRSLRDQCKAAGVPFLLKQLRIDGKLVKLPKLDGVIHDELPEAR